jgi:WD40 repeat protein
MLWHVADGRLLRTMRLDGEAIRSIALSPDGSTLACGCVDGDITLWKIN